MMTNSKSLRDIGYCIPKTCGICTYGHFLGNAKEGYCGKFKLPIIRHGGCEQGVIRQDVKEGPWGELVDRREFTRSNRHKAKVRY